MSKRKGIGLKNLVIVCGVLCLLAVSYVLGDLRGQRIPILGFSGGGSGYAVLDGCTALAAGQLTLHTAYSTQAKFFTCLGAIVALGQAMGENGDYCPPENVTNGEMTQVAVTYLVEHPAHLDRPYGELIFKALRRRWPCGESVINAP